MKTRTFFGLSGLLAAAICLSLYAAPAGAQEFGEDLAAPGAASEGDSWYRSPAVKTEGLSIAKQKAMARGQARQARLEALRWYGFSNSRPTAATMPFTTMYSPAWQMPGGRPFAWYTTARPIIVLDASPTVVR